MSKREPNLFELLKNKEMNQFIVKLIGSKVTVQVPQIKSIDREYIKSISNRAIQDVEQ